MIFNIPREVDEFLTLGFLSLFVISFLINTFIGANLNIEIAEVCYHITPANNSFEISPLQDYDAYMTQQYTENFKKSSSRAYWSSLILYFGFIPILCFYYAFFKFKKDIWNGEKIDFRRFIVDSRKKLSS